MCVITQLTRSKLRESKPYFTCRLKMTRKSDTGRKEESVEEVGTPSDGPRPPGALGSRSVRGTGSRWGLFAASHSDWWPLPPSLCLNSSHTTFFLCGVHPQVTPSLPSCQLLQFQTQLFSSVLRQMESLITFYRLG